MFTLRSKENEEFVVEESVVLQCGLFKEMIEDKCVKVNDRIPLQYVKSRTLAMALEYCKKHADSTLSDEVLKRFDSEFVEKPDPDVLELFNISRYLKIHELEDLTTQKIAKLFNLKNNFTYHDVLQIVDENAPPFPDM